MKKALLFVVAVGLVVWVVSWFRAPEAVAISAAKPWPGKMGAVDAIVTPATPPKENAAAVRLMALGKALPKSEAVGQFVQREIGRNDLAIGDAPLLADLSAIRQLLLTQPLVWERHEEIGNADAIATRVVQMTVARALAASALTKARKNDPAGWEDLHAIWILARSLDGHTQMMAQTAALSMARTVNAVAWRMPLPAPAWLAELQERDNVQPLLDAFQHQTASYWDDGARIFPTKWLADSVEHDRSIAESLFNLTRCDLTVPMNDLGTDLSSVWRRAFRYRAEREATANALRVREGKPIKTTSRCSDGAWSFDGTTLRFSREIRTAPPDVAMPLVLRIMP